MAARSSQWIRLITAITVCAGTTIPGAWVDRAEAQEGVELLPTPESVLGFRPGEARRLAGWSAISGEPGWPGCDQGGASAARRPQDDPG